MPAREVKIRGDGNFLSDDHAFLCGRALGVLMLLHDIDNDATVTPLLDGDGNYTPAVRVETRDGIGRFSFVVVVGALEEEERTEPGGTHG